jgi:hypothetical protein
MATEVLIVPTVQRRAFYSIRVRLDGRDYTAHFAWNQREERWYLSLHDAEDVPIFSGKKIVGNWPMLRYKKWDERCPEGELMPQDLTGDGSPPGFDELGEKLRVELTYYAAT